MDEEINGHNSPSRLDRLEKIVEVLANVQVDMQQTQGILLRAQVLMSEDIRKLTERDRVRAEQTDERFRAMFEAQTALMGTMDQIIRQRP